ncbi:MAG: HAMP domain-containing histidine kinase [Ruminococcus sp.]|nr:HAMP domain-containing histidine kinase [Ruminococcus sp.]MBQ9956124.1 HAMP domain-containing histidine kinase [Ruminococcus sp.]
MSQMPLSRKIWVYFMAFTVIVFVLLWVSQIFFLEHFYESMKVSDVAQASESIEKAYDELESRAFYDYIEETAVDNDLCIEILDRYGRPIYSCEVLGDCIIHGRGNSISTFWQRIKSSSEGVIYYKVKNPRSNYDMLVYGCEIGGDDYPDGYLLVNSALVPVGSTASIIKRQLKIITAILIVIAFVISLYVSKRIARPITKITESAQSLAKGDFSTEFRGEGYLEVKKLADTLNYAERELLKVDTMQRDLIANISHDLRTPLTMVKAYAELIRDLSGDKPEKRREHLEIIIDETDRLALLVNDVLDLSKLESGKEQLKVSEIDIKEELEEIIQRYKGVSEKRGYHIHLSSDESRMVKCDILKIEQVIYNLINNAINYTGEDRNVYVRQINLKDEVLIEIEDTGDGIEEDKINLIFDKYYRSENHKREVIGTGLGLSIVKAVLKLHNFDYGVRSTKGKGSVFWFKIKCEYDNVQNV